MWLLTAGPTREHLDEVRFLSNPSSGRMGYALAAEARARGHGVRLLSGPVSLEPPEGVSIHRVTSAGEMLAVGRKILEEEACEVLFGVAAVCDFRPRRRLPGKPPKEGGPRVLELVPNPDVLASLVSLGRAKLAFGFALEVLPAEPRGFTEAKERALAKLERKGLDAIVLNGLPSIEATTGRAVWLSREGREEDLGLLRKQELARILVDRIEALL